MLCVISSRRGGSDSCSGDVILTAAAIAAETANTAAKKQLARTRRHPASQTPPATTSRPLRPAGDLAWPDKLPGRKTGRSWDDANRDRAVSGLGR